MDWEAEAEAGISLLIHCHSEVLLTGDGAQLSGREVRNLVGLDPIPPSVAALLSNPGRVHPLRASGSPPSLTRLFKLQIQRVSDHLGNDEACTTLCTNISINKYSHCY